MLIVFVVELLGLVGARVDFQSIVGLGQRILRLILVSIQLVGGLIFAALVYCNPAHRVILRLEVLQCFGIRDHIPEQDD